MTSAIVEPGKAEFDEYRKSSRCHPLFLHGDSLFVLRSSPKGYQCDVDAAREAPGSARVVNGAVVSATGVSGVRYRRQIELSTALGSQEKQNALNALGAILLEVQKGRLADFRMIIRG